MAAPDQRVVRRLSRDAIAENGIRTLAASALWFGLA